MTSPRFVMLPTELAPTCSSEDHARRFTSYIVGINPSRVRLYDLLSRALAHLVPLFEHTLTDLHRTNPLTRRIHGSPSYSKWEEPDEPEHSDDEQAWSQYEGRMRCWVLQRPIELPDVPMKGYPGNLESRDFVVDLGRRTLKLIVKIEDIKLVRFC